MPGNTHSFPSSRTTGCEDRCLIGGLAEGREAYHPDIFSDEKDFGAFWEEGHTSSSGLLFLVLGGYPRTVFVHLGHADEGFGVVDERLVEGFGEGCIGDVWE
jgi:hypothetical protein